MEANVIPSSYASTRKEYNATEYLEARVIYQTESAEAFVQIEPGYGSTMNPTLKPGITLTDEFMGIDPVTRESVFYRYFNEAGVLESPKIPLSLKRSHPFFQNNLDFMRAYKMLFRPQMLIVDELEEQDSELDKFEAVQQAGKLLMGLKEEGKFNTLSDMLRRLTGPVADLTPRNIMLRLSRLAESDPNRVLALQNDPDYELKVLIDNAVQAKKILLQEDQFYKMPNGVVLANGLDEMVYKLKSDKGLRSYVENTSLPQQVLDENNNPVAAEAPKKRSGLPGGSRRMAPAEVQKQADAKSAQTGEIDEAHFRHVLQKAMDVKYFDDKQGGYMMPGNAVRLATLDEIVNFYRATPDLLKQLEKDLIGFGVDLN